MPQPHDATAQLPRASRNRRTIDEVRNNSTQKSPGCKQQQIFGGFSAKRSRQRTEKKEQSTQNQSTLCSDIEETVGEIAGENGGGAGALAETDGEAHNVTTDDGWKEECAEESAEVALRGSAEIERGAGSVDNHAPLENADAMRAEIQNENDHKTRGRNFNDCGTKRGDRKKMNERG